MDKIRVYNPRQYDIGLVPQSGMERVIHPGSFTPMARDAIEYAASMALALFEGEKQLRLCTFLDCGEIEISNNQVENTIRPFVVGRKCWLFSDTSDGAECSAVIYSLMETNKANGLRLEDYILHLLFVLPERFKADPDADIDDLLPWSDGMKDNFAML